MLRRLLFSLAVIALGLHAAAFAQPARDDDTELYDMLLGEIAQQRGDYALAAKTYLELARRTRDARVARRAVEVANQGRLNDLALDAAKTWYEIEPQSAAALSVVASLLVSARKVDEAEPYLAKLLNTEGVDQERGYLQINRLLAGNPDKRSNLRVVQKLASRHPELAPAHFATAQAAAPDYRDPDGARFILGQIAEEQKQWPRAVEWYEQIQDGEHALPARLRTANAIAKEGKLQAAREYLHKTAADHPGQEVQFTVAEAQLLRDANQNKEAFDLLGNALKEEPEQPELLYDYALTAEKLERFDVLEKNLRKLIEVKPDHAHAYNALGYSFADRNTRLGEARKLVEKALELSPEDSFIVDSLGWVQYREGDLKGAAQTLKRAYDNRPDAEIGAHLGEVLWVLGQRNEANRIWQESLKTAPDNETLLKTIKRLKK